MNDNVNHPAHYTQGRVECIDAMEAATVNKPNDEAIWVSNIIKYIWRYEDKGGIEDVEKAAWYINRLIKKLREKSMQYQLVGTDKGVGLQTPWHTLMVPHEGDMFNSKDEAREHLLKALLESGGFCPCQPKKDRDTMCPCVNYRKDNKCICGLFVKIPQTIENAEGNNEEKVERTDTDTEDGKEK